MKYEEIIKRAFRCGRTREFGADADIYRGLERASRPRPGQESVDQHELQVKVREVAGYLHSALSEIKIQNQEKEEFVTKINLCLEYLDNPSLENIDKCIEETVVAFIEI